MNDMLSELGKAVVPFALWWARTIRVIGREVRFAKSVRRFNRIYRRTHGKHARRARRA